jgi:glycosyltransferase involved in cell wall biosynthesis
MVAYTDYTTDTRVRREAEALVARGDTVEVISLRQNVDFKSVIINGVRVIPVPSNRYRGSSSLAYIVSYLYFFLCSTFILIHRHIREPYQIIQIHTMPDFMVFVAFVPKLLGAKVIIDIHDLMPELYQSKFDLTSSHWLIRFITWIEHCSVMFSNRAIAVHEPHLNALISHGLPQGKFITLLNLPDPRIFTLNTELKRKKSNDEFKLIYHGTLAKRHGLETAIYSLTELKRDIKSLSLKIIGEGDNVQYLQTLVHDLELDDCVEIIEGFIPIEQLIPVIVDADIGIVPIISDSFTKFMLPVKLLEYVSLGLPVICSRTETIETYFDDSMVQFFKPGDHCDLAVKIRMLYGDPGRREQLIINSKRFNNDFSWEKQKQTYFQLIDSLSYFKASKRSKSQIAKEI